jgi:Mrp family chromosome partitioning ATPase/uncharacterized protein involved in exopolysaccharide biosynthesis
MRARSQIAGGLIFRLIRRDPFAFLELRESIRWRKSLWMVMVCAPVLAALALTHFTNVSYIANAKLGIDKNEGSRLTSASAGKGADMLLSGNSNQNQISYLKSHVYLRDLARKLIESNSVSLKAIDLNASVGLSLRRMLFQVPSFPETEEEALTRHLKANLVVRALDKNTIQLSFRFADPDKANEIANELAATTAKILNEQYLRALLALDNYLKAELGKSVQRITELSQESEALRRKERLQLVASNNTFQNQKQIPLEESLADTELELNQNRNLITRLRNKIQSVGQNPSTEEEKARISTLTKRVVALETRAKSIRARLNKSADSLKKADEVQNTLDDTKRSLELEYIFFRGLSEKKMQLEMERISQTEKAQVFELADRQNIVSPLKRWVKVLLVFLLAVIGAFVANLQLESLDDTIKRRTDAEPAFSRLIGSLPELPLPHSGSRIWFSRSRQRTYSLNATALPVAQDAILNFTENALAVLEKTDPKIKIILLSSPSQGEGKTFLASNLSHRLASMGKRVALVNFSRDAISSDSLSNPQDLFPASREKLYRHPTNENLYVLDARAFVANATELMPGGDTSNLLDGLRERFDFVIIDSQSVLESGDTQILAGLVDMTVLLVLYRRTTRAKLETALLKLKQMTTTPVFTVLNRLDSSSEYSDPFLRGGGKAAVLRINSKDKSSTLAA